MLKYTIAVASILGLYQAGATRVAQAQSTLDVPQHHLIDEEQVVMQEEAGAESAEGEEEDRYPDAQALVDDIENELNVDLSEALGGARTVQSLNLRGYVRVATKFDAQFYVYSNLIRMRPSAFIPYLKSLARQFRGRRYWVASGRSGYWMNTQEGAGAVWELVRFLQRQRPLPLLAWSDNLAKAAKLLVKDHGPRGKTGHTGSDGSSPFSRISRYTRWQRTAGENCQYGLASPIGALLQLAIDDGVRSRGHRTNIFKREFAYMGSYTGYHRVYKYMTVADYSGSYKALNIRWPMFHVPTCPKSDRGYAKQQR